MYKLLDEISLCSTKKKNRNCLGNISLLSSEWANIGNILCICMSTGHTYIQNNAHFAVSSMPHFTLQPVHAQTSFVL